MDKAESITALYNIKSEIESMEPFKGRSVLIRDIIKKVRWLNAHKEVGFIGEKMVLEINRKLEEIKGVKYEQSEIQF